MKIAFTGGGTAGHAMVNTVLIPFLQQMDCHIIYLGSHNGMEKEMVGNLRLVKYYSISTGKLRRYYSAENFKDMFRVAAGYFEAYKILKAERPQVLYSSGGYVSVPAVLAARRLGIPVLIRETDRSMGLANRLCLPFATKVFTAFPDTQGIPGSKVKLNYPGVLIRPSLYQNSTHFCIAASGKPLCLIIGGSLGAQKINETIWNNIDSLTGKYDIIHICGKGNFNGEVRCKGVYQQLEYVHEDMGKLLNAANVVVTRCGSNAILETLALGKRTVCIPISSQSSRGEQGQNADFAAAHGNAVVLTESALNGTSLIRAIEKALGLQNHTPFHITQEQLLENIRTHADELYDIGLESLEKSFVKSLNGNTVINFNDLSNMELSIYDEIVSASGFDF